MSNDDQFFEKLGTEVSSQSGETALPKRRRSNSADYWDEDVQIRATDGKSGDKRWAANHDTFWGATQTYDRLPPGLYRFGNADTVGPILLKQKVEMDDIIELPDNASMSIIAEFGEFWKLEPEFRKRGFLMKRGFLLWGPAGSGKTTVINLLSKKIIENHDGIVVLIDYPPHAAACLRMIRQIEEKRPIVALLEDLDALIERHGENEYLALLDGEAQIDNCVYVGTTNYPERLDKRFLDRPSRFDTIKYIGAPGAPARKMFLKTKEPSLTDEELELWTRHTDGFTVAHLKELIIAVKCFGQPLDDVIRRLRRMHDQKISSESAPDKPSFGIRPADAYADAA